MSRLDPGRIRAALGEAAGLADLETLAEIDSTNSYLMRQAAPAPGRYRVAVTDNQTSGRGRHGRTWESPPGSGLCLSMAYTFERSPDSLPALTLAVGIGVIESLGGMDIGDVNLKWPNDLVAMDGKLGGILTETKAGAGGMTVVTGVGINIELPPALRGRGDWAPRAVDLRTHVGHAPVAEDLAAALIGGLQQTFVIYEEHGFAAYFDRWASYDWLYGRDVAIAAVSHAVNGTAAGIAEDGALLVETASGETQRIASGSVAIVGSRS